MMLKMGNMVYFSFSKQRPIKLVIKKSAAASAK